MQKQKQVLKKRKATKSFCLLINMMMVIFKPLGPVGRIATWCTSKQRVSSMQAQTFNVLNLNSPMNVKSTLPESQGLEF